MTKKKAMTTHRAGQVGTVSQMPSLNLLQADVLDHAVFEAEHTGLTFALDLPPLCAVEGAAEALAAREMVRTRTISAECILIKNF